VLAAANDARLVFTLEAQALPQMGTADSRFEDSEFAALCVTAI
jgi:hypothetical protein